MMQRRGVLRVAGWALWGSFVAACGGESTGPNPTDNNTLPTPSVACTGTAPLTLEVGQHTIVDPAQTSGCLRLPAAGPDGAQYLMSLVSTASIRSSSGIQGPYLLRGSSPGIVTTASDAGAAASVAAGTSHRSVVTEFDAVLREKERTAVAEARALGGPLLAPALAAGSGAPPVGDVKSFKVCTNLSCSAFSSVTATARYVGAHAAIYMDNAVPADDPLQPGDLAELGTAFDTYHYGIDTTAFGRESDIDGNGVVIILMTDAVNDLTPDCTNGRVIGYFYGGDLLVGTNSNRGEIFYTLVPAPKTDKCAAATRRQVLDNLKPTLIHEFQHMISFNQHVLVRGGDPEQTWLNEALSHFAEELGGRLIPNNECTVSYTSCRSQYASGDILNAYDYLKNPEAHFLVFPTSSSGTLEERGSSWLFLRWVLDQFAADSIQATDLTRQLVATANTGVNNLQAVTGTSFSTMVPQWLMAAYLDDGTELPAEPTGRLRYKSWGLRSIWTNPVNASSFPLGFPAVADLIGGSYTRSGTLRGGSGRLFKVVQSGNGPAIDLRVLRNTAGDALDPALAGRFGIVRIK